MYDTINYMLPCFEILEPNAEKRIIHMLTKSETIFNQETKQTWVRGNYKNLRLSFTEKGIWFTGSIAKYYYGAATENFLRFDDLEPAFETLASELSLPSLTNALVRRVDFGQNIQTQTKSSLYLKTLLGMPRMERREQSSTSLLFVNKKRAFNIYDKTAEMKSRKIEISPNTLRLESRILKRANDAFKVEQLKVYDLSKDTFHKRLIELWHKQYLSIDKSTLVAPDFTFTTPNQLNSLLAAFGLQMLGLPAVRDSISTNKEQGNISKNTENRSKKMLKGLSLLGNTHSLVDELNAKVESAYNELLNQF